MLAQSAGSTDGIIWTGRGSPYTMVVAAAGRAVAHVAALLPWKADLATRPTGAANAVEGDMAERLGRALVKSGAGWGKGGCLCLVQVATGSCSL